MKLGFLSAVVSVAYAVSANVGDGWSGVDAYPHDSATYVKKVAVNFLEFVAAQAPRSNSDSAKDSHIVSAFVRANDDYGCVISNFKGDRTPLKQNKVILKKDMALGLPVIHENGRHIVKYEFDYYCNDNIHGHRTFDMRPFAPSSQAASDSQLNLAPVIIETGLNSVISVGNAVPFIKNAMTNDIVVSVNPTNARFVKAGHRHCDVKTSVTLGASSTNFVSKLNFETEPNLGKVWKLPIRRSDANSYKIAKIKIDLVCGVAKETHEATLQLLQSDASSLSEAADIM